MKPVVRQAAVWKRIIAFIIDLFIVAFACVSLVAVIGGESAPRTLAEATSSMPNALQMTASFYFALFFFLYHFFCEYIISQTAGMFLLGLHVERSEGNDKPRSGKTGEQTIGFGQTFIRNLFIFPLIPGVILGLIWIIEPIYYVIQGRRLLEYFSKTDTVEYIR